MAESVVQQALRPGASTVKALEVGRVDRVVHSRSLSATRRSVHRAELLLNLQGRSVVLCKLEELPNSGYNE